jgi:hypothetical protein
VRIEYSRKAFGQKFIDCLGPKIFNLMPVNIKREIFYTEENNTTIYRNEKKKFRFGYFNTWLNNKELYLTIVIYY